MMVSREVAPSMPKQYNCNKQNADINVNTMEPGHQVEDTAIDRIDNGE